MLLGAPASGQVYEFNAGAGPYDSVVVISVPTPPPGSTMVRVSIRHGSTVSMMHENLTPSAFQGTWFFDGRYGLVSGGHCLGRGREVSTLQADFSGFDGVLDFDGPSGETLFSASQSYSDALFPASVLASGQIVLSNAATFTGTVSMVPYSLAWEARIRIEYLP